MDYKYPIPNILSGEKMTLKGVVLAGGFGSRLIPLTYITNKHLLPVYNKPMIEYGLETLHSIEIESICVITGGSKGEEVQKFLGDGYQYNIKLHYNWQGEPKGIAHAILCAKEFVSDNPFVVYLGDNIYPEGIEGFVQNFEKSDADAKLLLTEVQDPERYGVVEIHEGKIIGLEEKPKKPKSNLIITGCYCFKPTVFDIIKQLKPSGRGEYEITEALQILVDSPEHKVEFHILDSLWYDCGTFDSILEAAIYMRNKQRGR